MIQDQGLAAISDIHEEDTALIRGLAKKDPAVLQTLYDRYASVLFGIVHKMLGDHALGEDVLQEAFTRIWEHGKTYDPAKGRLFTWMLNICRNAAIDSMRSKGFKKFRMTTHTADPAASGLDSPQEGVKPELIGIREIVEALKPDWKELIELIYFRGFTQQEASESLNLPLGTVKTRLRSAMMFLREEFIKEGH